MALLRPNFRTESDTQNAGNGISGVQISKFFRGGMPPDPPSSASISAMIPSDLRLDPPLSPVQVYWMENWPQHSLILDKVSFAGARMVRRLKCSQIENASREIAVVRQLAKDDQWHLKCPGKKQGKVMIWHVVFVKTEIVQRSLDLMWCSRKQDMYQNKWPVDVQLVMHHCTFPVSIVNRTFVWWCIVTCLI
jgi:hypothetical protein